MVMLAPTQQSRYMHVGCLRSCVQGGRHLHPVPKVLGLEKDVVQAMKNARYAILELKQPILDPADDYFGKSSRGMTT